MEDLGVPLGVVCYCGVEEEEEGFGGGGGMLVWGVVAPEEAAFGEGGVACCCSHPPFPSFGLVVLEGCLNQLLCSYVLVSQ